jgi:hypothetical protein
MLFVWPLICEWWFSELWCLGIRVLKNLLPLSSALRMEVILTCKSSWRRNPETPCTHHRCDNPKSLSGLCSIILQWCCSQFFSITVVVSIPYFHIMGPPMQIPESTDFRTKRLHTSFSTSKGIKGEHLKMGHGRFSSCTRLFTLLLD